MLGGGIKMCSVSYQELLSGHFGCLVHKNHWWIESQPSDQSKQPRSPYTLLDAGYFFFFFVEMVKYINREKAPEVQIQKRKEQERKQRHYPLHPKEYTGRKKP